MKEAINLFYEDYAKAFKMTKTHYNNLNTLLQNFNKGFVEKDNSNYEQNLREMVKLHHKLIASNYLMVETYLKIAHVKNLLDEKQQKLINLYRKMENKVAELNFEVMNFIADHTKDIDKIYKSPEL